MKWIGQGLLAASLVVTMGFSVPRAADCTATQTYMAAFLKASDVLDRENARYSAMKPPPRYDMRVCNAARKTTKAIKDAVAQIDPGCLKSTAAYNDAIKSLGDMLPHIGAQEGLICAPGK